MTGWSIDTLPNGGQILKRDGSHWVFLDDANPEALASWFWMYSGIKQLLGYVTERCPDGSEVIRAPRELLYDLRAMLRNIERAGPVLDQQKGAE